ncbi:MAG: hypothetical protein L0Y78_08425 [candidate division NC10 bacterium]|nr:hypothetical protein [candidate division NC10 bacterium]
MATVVPVRRGAENSCVLGPRAPATVAIVDSRVLASMVFRTPLALLPGPGRDEAAYFYWAVHGEFSYTPLMLASVRGLHELGFPALAAIRIPSLLGGVVSLVLFDRFLEVRGADRRSRLAGLLALAVAPWHVWVGSVLHPDPWFLSALLALCLALHSGRLVGGAMLGGMAALAKPTGFVLLPVLGIWLWRVGTQRARLVAIPALLGIAALAMVGLSPGMIREMAEFGRLDPGLPLLQCVAIVLQDLLIGGGLLLFVAGIQGFIESARFSRPGSAWSGVPPLILAATLIVFFLAAALLNRQIKGNWLLPALVLLWPSRGLWIPKPLIGMFLLASVLASTVMVGMARNPSLAARMESEVPALRIYRERAGTREDRVSPTGSWSDRFREYQSLKDEAAEASWLWERATGETAPPRWIVSDDYGLASQLAYHWHEYGTRLVVPSDGLFVRGLHELEQGHAHSVLLVATQAPLDRVWPRMGSAREIGVLAHPAMDGRIRLGVLTLRGEGRHPD